ncbi:MAG: molybdopterin-dependent oxidoreductase, partial [Geminicoccaceae bacterium]
MRYVLLLSALALFASVPASTDAGMPQPTDETLLTVTGKIRETNAEGRLEFDRSLLMQLGLSKLTPSTPWTDGERAFMGVPFASLLDAIGATGTIVRAVAANDYVVDIPISNLREANAFLAMSMDGTQLRLRDKGPLWIIYPWSQRPELNRIELHGYAVWQLQSLHIE